LSWICHLSSSCKWHWAFQFLKIICDPRRIHAIKIWSWHSFVLFKCNFGVCWCLRLWNHHCSTVCEFLAKLECLVTWQIEDNAGPSFSCCIG
jgi:hypothetical protein